MHLETAEIDRYGPLKGCRPDCEDGITVIAGPNESGKTLYLEGLLRLLEPNVKNHISPKPRVEGTPTGRLVLHDGSDHHSLGDGTVLSDISQIEPIHLHNLFVVRDSDLGLPEGQDYYTSLVEHLGDIHTSEINQIRSELVERGRLTNKRLNLANRENDTKDVRKNARSLASEIESYLDTMSEKGIRETNRERLQTKRKLATVEKELETQRVAEKIADYEYAAGQLRVYRETTDRIQQLKTFDRDTLGELQELDGDISRDEEEIEDLDEEIESKKEEAREYQDELSELREKRMELQQRESDVNSVEETLETYRDKTAADVGSDSKLAQRRAVTIAGIASAGIAATGGAIAGSMIAIMFGVLLLFVGAGGWYSHHQLAQRIKESEVRERELLQDARDAGFDVDEPEDIAPTIRGFRDELESVQKRIQRLKAELDTKEDRISELEDEYGETETQLEKHQDELESTLDDAGVDSIDEYESNIKERENEEDERSGAKRDLTREVGEPEADAPEEKIEYWEAELNKWKSSISDTDIEADQYDEEELKRLEERSTGLERRLDKLEKDLEEHRDTLGEFERRGDKLNAGPFVETEPTLQAYTAEGLRELAEELRSLVETIETDAEISRKAIGIFENIRDEEEQKMATLFDPDGPASKTLSYLTDGRYTAVDYDPDSKTLEVRTADGQTLNPYQLSRGTQDQLYFAARLSLAKQLLGGETGFLLLDDPFIAADQNRLRYGFETLTDLAEEGWQIVYLTAKQEVRNTMTSEFDVNIHEMNSLDY